MKSYASDPLTPRMLIGLRDVAWGCWNGRLSGAW